MNPAAPVVSVLIPTFNRAQYLGEAIRSVLAQDYPALEVIVLDNASTDATPEMVQRFATDPRLRSVRNAENLGMVGNWRRGLYECATGEWFLILSDDDYLTDPAYLSKALQLADAPDVVLAYANGEILHEDTGRRVRLTLPFRGVVEGREVFLSRNQVAPQDFTLCNVLFRRRLAIAQEAFQNSCNLACDSELFLRMCLLGKVAACGDYVSVYRVHRSNLIGGFEKDFETLLNSADTFMNPYWQAMRRGTFSARQLRTWRRHTIRRHLRWTLRMVRQHHPARLGEALSRLHARHGEMFWRNLPLAKRLPLWLRWRRAHWGAAA